MQAKRCTNRRRAQHAENVATPQEHAESFASQNANASHAPASRHPKNTQKVVACGRTCEGVPRASAIFWVEAASFKTYEVHEGTHEIHHAIHPSAIHHESHPCIIDDEESSRRPPPLKNPRHAFGKKLSQLRSPFRDGSPYHSCGGDYLPIAAFELPLWNLGRHSFLLDHGGGEDAC